MAFLSFGKIAVRADLIEAFIKEARQKGLVVRPIQANIYEFGMETPSLFDPVKLRKEAGMLGLKYCD